MKHDKLEEIKNLISECSCLANESSTPEDNDKYTSIANTLIELFYKEIQSMKL